MSLKRRLNVQLGPHQDLIFHRHARETHIILSVHLDDGVKVVHDVLGSVALYVSFDVAQLLVVGWRHAEQALVVVVLGMGIYDPCDVFVPLMLQYRLDYLEGKFSKDPKGRLVVI